MDIRRSTGAKKKRFEPALRWASNLCLVAGAVALVLCSLVWAEAHLFQEFASRYFSSELNASTARAHFGDQKPASEQLKQLSQPIKVDSLIGKLAINRLGLSVIVLEGVGDKTLRIAAGHVPDTALPGRAGNVVIAAHRDTFFRSLRNIHPNDIITISTTWGSYRYRVENTSVVKPNRVDVLDPTPSPTLTLITCFPFYYVGSAPLRFIVRARQISPAMRALTASERTG
jgi:sortase A